MTRYADPIAATITPEQRSRHDDANAELMRLLTEQLIGSGYRPTQWCISRVCMQPYSPDLTACPSCGQPNTRHAAAMQGVTQ
ncbi:hypothetical protein [Deinococcus soli (ex Cha et al. 2016)]|uniref:Uncharacterized protein n=1 Tax=Deinococcus soli (ex Cha et al. 2016) TaxID=1309411 RepID=A0ACC6KLK3_9DEIO|nr:hypothetical protein [Deinococcus soli (ex Cha et al. 2016)]MDR6753468.1 hypothetical protein [Deinococcus soli (ex Cha et al. 2016)]